MAEFFYTKDHDNIAHICWDLPNRSMNILSLRGIVELEACIDKALADENTIGAIITSKKKDFSAGMDLNVLGSEMDQNENNFSESAFELILKIHKILRKIELAGRDSKEHKKGKPIVWACSGISAGIGTEIGLACHHRIATTDPKTKIGLPEILVGLFPFGGGTTRVVRMLGAFAASPVILEGKMFSASAAKSVGIVDNVCEPAELLEKASNWIKTATEQDIIKPWDTKKFKIPGGSPYHPAGFLTFVGASAMVNGRTQGVYPAHKALLSAAYEGLLVPFELALKIEARWAVNLLNKKSTKNMIRSLFINKSALEKGAARPKSIIDQSVKEVGILGAGMMGAGIAYASAVANISVVLIDETQVKADGGKDKVKEILNEGKKRGKITEEIMNKTLDNILPTTDYRLLNKSDLIIEAVFEEIKIKKAVTLLAEDSISSSTIFASNTSTLPISELAKASKNPANFIGIHFFSPVHKMSLVEIIKGSKTGNLAIAKALDFVKQIKKTPIVVNDARFFYANRCIIPYINEGVKMVGEGISPALIENSAKLLGMPVGPLQLIDETSIDLAHQIATATKLAMGKNYKEDESDLVLAVMMKNKRFGRKVKAGFYSYDDNGRRREFWEGLSKEWSPAEVQPDSNEVKMRLGLIQALEAARALEEGVLNDIREGDVGAILGWGCLPWAGGPFGWMDLLGANKILTISNDFASKFGSRFKTPNNIIDLAKVNGTFY